MTGTSVTKQQRDGSQQSSFHQLCNIRINVPLCTKVGKKQSKNQIIAQKNPLTIIACLESGAGWERQVGKGHSVRWHQRWHLRPLSAANTEVTAGWIKSNRHGTQTCSGPPPSAAHTQFAVATFFNACASHLHTAQRSLSTSEFKVTFSGLTPNRRTAT